MPPLLSRPPCLLCLPRLPCPWHSPRPPYLPHAAVSACRPACHVCRACRVRGIRRVRHTCRMLLYPHAAPPVTSAAPAVSARLLHPLPLRMPCPSRPPHVAASACRRICCIRRVPMLLCPQRAGEPRPGRPCAARNERGAPRKGTLLFVRSGGTFARRPFRSVISRLRNGFRRVSVSVPSPCLRSARVRSHRPFRWAGRGLRHRAG